VKTELSSHNWKQWRLPTNARSKWWLSLALFAVGVSCTPVVFIASGVFAGPDWTGTSKFLDLFAIPIVCFGGILCAVAPLVLPGTLLTRVLLAFASLSAFFVIGILVAFLCLLRFGLPIR
jgi:hypothetical protein